MGNQAVNNRPTQSQTFVKGIDFFTEEWMKQLLQNVSGKKIENSNAFVGVIKFPGTEFLDHQNEFHTTTQFQNSIYVGYIDMLVPKPESNASSLAYTKLSFNLDGVVRTFVQYSGGNVIDGANVKFKDFVLGQFPDANKDVVFNHNAVHYLTDIQLQGSNYQLGAGGVGFVPVNSGNGAFTPSVEFEFLVSGYKAYVI